MLIPIELFCMPSELSNYTILNLILWAIFFGCGLFVATYGVREFGSQFDHILNRFTVKSTIRRGANTDIRNMGKEMPLINDYDPQNFIKLKKGIFIGLDEHVKPIYLKLNDWLTRHF
jgi:hypothetical protein